jgi:hypothetical protein
MPALKQQKPSSRTYSAKAYGEEGERVVFKVVFEPDSSEVIECYALDLNSGCCIG